jgi:hypothetical protein
VRPLRLAAALFLVVVAAAAAVLAADVRSWQRTLAHDVNGTPPEAHLPWDPAGRLLAVGDDVEARRAVALFKQAASTHGRLDDALAVIAERARAESALAAVAQGSGRRASQAGTLLGILAFGDLARGGGRNASQAETAIADFDAAVRADQTDESAKFDLELLLRSLAARGVRTGPNAGSGTGSTGRRGAGSGSPGSGY